MPTHRPRIHPSRSPANKRAPAARALRAHHNPPGSGQRACQPVRSAQPITAGRGGPKAPAQTPARPAPPPRRRAPPLVPPARRSLRKARQGATAVPFCCKQPPQSRCAWCFFALHRQSAPSSRHLSSYPRGISPNASCIRLAPYPDPPFFRQVETLHAGKNAPHARFFHKLRAIAHRKALLLYASAAFQSPAHAHAPQRTARRSRPAPSGRGSRSPRRLIRPHIPLPAGEGFSLLPSVPPNRRAR